MLSFALTIFASAFLLFQVQPLIARYILPWFGGTPAVWTTCMLFFQVLLLAGYGYVHATAMRLAPRRQVLLHAALLAASLLLLPIGPEESWKPSGDEAPAGRILLLLAATVGFPYLMLSTTGPLLQSWFARVHPGRSPYRLFALSNLGSLLALVSYPLLVEPFSSSPQQAVAWSLGYVLFAALCGWCAWLTLRAAATSTESAETRGESESMPPREARDSSGAMWLALAAVPSLLLLAVTDELCQQVASAPFLWVLPLALYLLSFILCFDSDRWYRRRAWLTLLIVAAAAGGVRAASGGIAADLESAGDSAWLKSLARPFTALDDVPFWFEIGTWSLVLLCCCMICHGELARRRPDPRRLTRYYLTIAAGGALGGVFVGLVAPLAFDRRYELPLGLALFVALLLLIWRREGRERRETGSAASQLGTRGRALRRWGGAALLIALAAAGGYAWMRANENVVHRSRNFYGVLKVERAQDEADETFLELFHGAVSHGMQYEDEALRRRATTYYGESGGGGLAILQHPRREAAESSPAGGSETKGLHVGVIGLGVGTLATYGRPGDRLRFYEIDPGVVRVARDSGWFSYLHDCQAEVEVVLGDARIKLEQELAAGRSQQFDVLVIDAFSGDAIPMHLVTRECFELYLGHLRPNGVLAFHISNRHLDLRPVVFGLAEEAGLTALEIDDEPEPDWQYGSRWVLATRSQEFLSSAEIRAAGKPLPGEVPRRIWTDQFGSLLQVMK